ncbi:hypothetical protein ES705_07275 [subsurface metagenome]
MATIATLAVRLTGDATNLMRALDRSERRVRGFGGTLGTQFMSMGKSVNAFALKAAKAAAVGVGLLGVAIAGLGVLSVKAAMDLESSWTGVLKTTDGLVDEFGKLTEQGAVLKQGFRDLSKEVPVAVGELMEIGEMGGQLGIAEENLLSFTGVIADLVATTVLGSEDAAVGLARFMNVMGTEQTMIENVGSAIVALGNNFAVNEAELVAWTERLSASGAIAGMTEADVLGFGAAFASVGIEAGMGGTAVAKALSFMQMAVAQGGSELELYAKTSGMAADEFVQAWEEDAAGAFASFVKGLGESGDEAFFILDELKLKDQQAMRALLALGQSGDLLFDSLEMANTAFEENTALAAEAALRYGTTESQMAMFKNTLKDVAATAGETLLPILNDLLEVAKPLIEAFGSKLKGAMEKIAPIIEQIKNFFLAWIDAGWGSVEMMEVIENLFGQEGVDAFNAISDAVGGFFDFILEHKDAILGALAGIGAVLVTSGIFAAIPGILLGIGAAFAFLISPLGIVFAVVAALGAMWATNFLGIRDIVTEVWENTLRPAFELLIEWLQVQIPIAIAWLSNLWETVLLPALQVVWGFISGVLIPIFMAVWGVITAVLGKALEAFALLWTNVLQPALKTVWEWINDKIVPVMTTLWEWIKDKVGPILEWFSEFVIQPLIEGFGGILDVVEKVVGWLSDLKDIIDGLDIKKLLPFLGGSPAPLAIGFASIADSMRDLNRTEFPMLQANLAGLTAVGLPGSGGEGDFNVTIHGARIGDDQALRDKINRVRLLEGAG